MVFDALVTYITNSTTTDWLIAIMKGVALSLLVVLLCIYHLDAFLTNPYHSRTSSLTSSSSQQSHTAPSVLRATNDNDNDKDIAASQLFTHKDIVWKLRPPPDSTSFLRRLALRLAANLIRLECKLSKTREVPFCLCPKGGQAVLEAHVGNTKVARFGITTVRGPPAPLMDESVEDLFDIQLEGRSVGSAAIIYMVIPDDTFRKRGIGALALEVIATIHALQSCDFTVLVADDDGSGKLVQWYEAHGFKKAPKLQDFMGSPGGQYGITMMAPTNAQLDPECKLQWW